MGGGEGRGEGCRQQGCRASWRLGAVHRAVGEGHEEQKRRQKSERKVDDHSACLRSTDDRGVQVSTDPTHDEHALMDDDFKMDPCATWHDSKQYTWNISPTVCFQPMNESHDEF